MTPSNGHHDKPTDILNQVYDALSHPLRRRLLLSLQKEDPRTTEEVTTMQAGPEYQKRDVLLKLRHVHLPHLANTEFIEWDQESETITKGPQFEELRPHLDILREQR